MRILLLSHGYAPTLSGVTVVVEKLAKDLTGRGHQVAVVTGSETKKPYRSNDDGIPLIRLRSVHNPVWSEGPIPVVTRRTLAQIVEEFQPDVIHTHENFVMAIQLARLRRRLRRPMVLSSHALPDFTGQHMPEVNVLNRASVRIVWRYMIALLNCFDTVVFPTRTHRDLYVAKGLRADSAVISNGVDRCHFHPANGKVEDVALRYQLPPGKRILFVGRLCRDKNLEPLIRAMPEIWHQQRAHLLLVGRGDYRPELEQLVQELGVGHCVHFLGFVPDADLPAIYRSVHLFAITSTVEVQSIPTLQALVTGLPVVGADAAALPELVHDHVNGFLVPPYDVAGISRGAVSVLRSPDLQHRFSQASIAIGRHHEESYTFKAFVELYQQMVVSRWRWSPQPIPARRKEALAPTVGVDYHANIR